MTNFFLISPPLFLSASLPLVMSPSRLYPLKSCDSFKGQLDFLCTPDFLFIYFYHLLRTQIGESIMPGHQFWASLPQLSCKPESKTMSFPSVQPHFSHLPPTTTPQRHLTQCLHWQIVLKEDLFDGLAGQYIKTLPGFTLHIIWHIFTGGKIEKSVRQEDSLFVNKQF